MFDLLRPLTKLTYVTAFVAFLVAANAALLFALSACITDTACIGTGNAAGTLQKMREISGLFLPTNFYACIQFLLIATIAKRAYDYGVKVMQVTTQAS